LKQQTTILKYLINL